MGPATLLLSCVAMLNLASGQVTRAGDLCDTPLSPASTFKIPHALVALETGVVTESTVEKWDGTRHPAQPSWDADHTVLSAMKPSVLWFFQRIAPRIGAGRMHDWLSRFEYGNAKTSGPIAEYWVNGTLRVSVNEQVRFLERFYKGTLPVSGAHATAVRQSLDHKPGTFQNARGVHPITLGPPGGRLNAKTGATTIASGESVSWLVGRITNATRDYVFAGAAWRQKGDRKSVV
jgi:beta-lactamase class D